MAIFVNFYPCSYGDSLATMFSGQTKNRTNRTNGIIISNYKFFKLPYFYTWSRQEQNTLLDNINPGIYSCHRQNGINLYPHKIISIVLDKTDFLPRRFMDIQVGLFNKDINPTLIKLKDKISYSDLIMHDYKTWAKTNILANDIKFPISFLNNKQEVIYFCEYHNLKYDNDMIDSILNDMVRYS